MRAVKSYHTMAVAIMRLARATAGLLVKKEGEAMAGEGEEEASTDVRVE